MQLKQFDEAATYLVRAQALSPDAADVYEDMAWLRLASSGDTMKVREEIQLGLSRVGAERLIPTIYRTGAVSLLLIGAEPPDLATFHALPIRVFGADTAFYFLLNAELYRYQGRMDAARVYADSARPFLQSLAKASPDEWVYHSLLGVGEAIGGRREIAVQEAKRAVEVLPLAKDAIGGQAPIAFLARVYTIVGEKDLAVSQLKTLLGLPSFVTVASLRIDPGFASLRGYPAFERLLAGR